MAKFGSVNVHGCERITATMVWGFDDPSCTWLRLDFGGGQMCEVSVFMPRERAKALAAAINHAETDYAESAVAQLAPAFAVKDHWTHGDAVPKPFPAEHDPHAEHRLTQRELV